MKRLEERRLVWKGAEFEELDSHLLDSISYLEDLLNSRTLAKSPFMKYHRMLIELEKLIDTVGTEEI